MQPGDNFRALASTSSAAAFNGFSSKQNDKDQARIKDANNKIVQNSNSLAISELLTVWRRLNIEIDSMGVVSGNSIAGTITKVNSPALSPWREIETGLAYSDSSNRFENGTITIGGRSYPICSQSGTTNLKFGIRKDNSSNPTVPVVGDSFVAYDDDIAHGNQVPDPDVSFLKEAFAPAYVDPVFNGGDGRVEINYNSSNLPFYNYTAGSPGVVRTERGSNDFEDDYWAAYVRSVFQPQRRLVAGGPWLQDQDGDPDSEVVLLGGNSWDPGVSKHVGVLIFHEVIRDRSQLAERYIVAHEIGHYFLPPGVHLQDGYLMSEGTQVTHLSFGGAFVAIVRGFKL